MWDLIFRWCCQVCRLERRHDTGGIPMKIFVVCSCLIFSQASTIVYISFVKNNRISWCMPPWCVTKSQPCMRAQCARRQPARVQRIYLHVRSRRHAGMSSLAPSHAPGSSWTGRGCEQQENHVVQWNGWQWSWLHGHMNRCHVHLPNFMSKRAATNPLYHKCLSALQKHSKLTHEKF